MAKDLLFTSVTESEGGGGGNMEVKQLSTQQFSDMYSRGERKSGKVRPILVSFKTMKPKPHPNGEDNKA